jgi:hypothetical protein
MSLVRLRVRWLVNSIGRGADYIENTASSIVARWAVFTELLPDNALIKSVIISSKRVTYSKNKILPNEILI